MSRCEQCGREGTRGFRQIGPTKVRVAGERSEIPAITVCASRNACWIRRERQRPRRDDSEYA